MKANTLPSLYKCKNCGDIIEDGSKCLSCIYFETNYPGQNISKLASNIGDDARDATADLISITNEVTTNTRLINLEGETEGILGLKIPGVKGTVTMKYKINLLKGFSSSGDDIIPIKNIELLFNRGIPEETRKLTRPFKNEIEQIVRKAFYGEK